MRVVCCVHRTLYARNQTLVGDTIRKVSGPYIPYPIVNYGHSEVSQVGDGLFLLM